MKGKIDYSIKSFLSQAKWEVWLKKNHQKENGIWLRMYKKASQKPTVTYDQALEVALCYGWIDGLKRSFDAESWIQKFTPRRPRSVWSKRNTVIVERLIKEDRMQAAGLAQIEVAKKDGRWEAAYAGQKDMKLPPDFLKVLEKNKKAWEFYQTLNSTNRYAIAYRLHEAKRPETKLKRMKTFLEMLEREEAFHSVMSAKKK